MIIVRIRLFRAFVGHSSEQYLISALFLLCVFVCALFIIGVSSRDEQTWRAAAAAIGICSAVRET